ncbi:SMP-30/gluconolactonase/LRE family protein [Humitalea sp. 24SJ18S-53]|uniref:SMP-30/gluconolactonase/LRE family protein n=1 Tax=Humitalea sp. 24SJ18S-53 TaxID=3422307 RepID=UPI003D67F44B
MFGFPPPRVIPTEVFATLPDTYRRTGVGAPRTRSRSGSVLEGPSFDLAGNLYITDIPNGRVFRIAPDGTFALVAEYDGEPNGLKIHQDGRIFIADHRHGLMLLDPASGAVTSFLEGPDKERFKGVNDLVFARNGDLFFTDQGQTGLHDPTGRVYRLTPDGQLTALVGNVPSPNGIVLNRSEKVVFVAATRSNEIWILPLTDKGGVTKAGLFAQLPCPGPDGMALDAKGNLAVAHPGLGIVWLFDKRGLPIGRVESCAGAMVMNVAYGGPDNRWLYITEAASCSVLRAEMPEPGLALFSHAGA